MKFNPNEDFNKNVSKLLTLLKNMLKNQKIDNKELNDFFGKKDINLNLCFFTFLPFPMEEMDDVDLEEMMDEELVGEENKVTKDAVDLKFELNSNDLDFLKKNGIKF